MTHVEMLRNNKATNPEGNPGKPHGLKQKENKLGNGMHAVQNKQIQTAYNNVQKWLK